KVLRSVADQGPDLVPALQRESEALKSLGTVNGVEHPSPTNVLRTTALLQQSIDGNEVCQVGLLRVGYLFHTHPCQEIDHPPIVVVHCRLLRKGVAASGSRPLGHSKAIRPGEKEDARSGNFWLGCLKPP